ncbi:MAG: hydroxymethylglutaryl-CoA lyase [Bacteroidetes bacterium]|nr:hydroxymethylglutaryl-CoA lyase [Bacteroidota bacterium]
MLEALKIVECPRDAMQGIHEFIPTELKTAYINSLLKVGFDTVDFGSFVSPKAIPQLRDTAQVLANLDLDATASRLLAIVANQRGATDAGKFPEINYLGYPFSISETFQQRNTKRGIEHAWQDVQEITNLARSNNQQMVVYLSMGFGNPYGDEWSVGLIEEWTEKFHSIGVSILSLADTIGAAQPADITYIFDQLIKNYPSIEFGAHFHSRPNKWREKVDAAYKSGCRRFDSAIKGYGGCPFAKDELVGNIATENLLTYFDNQDQPTHIDVEAFGNSVLLSSRVFDYE